MTHDDGRLLVASIIGFGGGIYTFLKGFREYRKYRLVADTPAIHIRSIPMGLVQIQGEARAEQTIPSPVTHTPCYLFKVVVEQWHTDSKGGGEWKHVATDVQSVKFDLQDATGNVLVDATNAELDLPRGVVRKVRSHALGAFSKPNVPPAGGSRVPPTDTELLQYVEQARLRHATQMLGRGIGFVTHSSEPSHQQKMQPLLSMLADPTGSGAEAFRNQMMRAMMAKRDPSGETTRLALEVWKHPQGTPEFDSALVRFGQAYMRMMGPSNSAPDASAVLAYAHQPQAMAMLATFAGAADPQADPDAERARQAALAYGHDHGRELMPKGNPTASGEFRLAEYCLVPGQTYDITGTCAENPNPRDEYDRNIILKGTNEPTFLISSKAAKEVSAWLRKRALWMILGGPALAVVCLAFILWKLGMF